MRARKRARREDGGGLLVWGIVGAGAIVVGLFALSAKKPLGKREPSMAPPQSTFTTITQIESAQNQPAAAPAATAAPAESQADTNRRISIESAAFKTKEIAKLNRTLGDSKDLPAAEKEKMREEIGNKQREIDFLKKKYNFTEADMSAAKVPEP